MGAPAPVFIPQPFGENADTGFINTIPDTTGTPGLASYDQGFPQLTMTPEVSGGVPPFGQDFNGILFALSTHSYYAQAGQLYLYSSAVSAKISGYAPQTILASTDGVTIWYNTVNGNTTDPDGGSAAGWVPLYAYGISTVAVTTGTATLTQSQAAPQILKFTGTLSGNVIVIVPLHVQQWIIINATTGAFTLTVKGASGTGVVIPQTGAAAPSGIYGDGTNIYLTSITTAGLAPIASPTFTGIPAGPTASTSTNTTQLATTAFVKANLALYALLAGPTFTGVPKAPTAPVGTRTTQLATTAFANPTGSLAAEGNAQLPGGLIINWGAVNVANGTGAAKDCPVTFSRPFPNACVAVIPTSTRTVGANGQALDGSNFAGSITTLGATLVIEQGAGGRSIGTWVAFGY